MVATKTTDLISMITEQHGTIRQLMSAVETAAPERRDEAFEPLVRLLAVHETAEEEIVYPYLRSTFNDAAAVVDARLREEDAAKKALADLEQTDRASAQFASAFAMFRRDVDTHARHEEAEVFPLLERAPRDELETMGKGFAAAEAMAPTHAHRMAPESALGNLLVGPFVAMVDRVRDAIRDARKK